MENRRPDKGFPLPDYNYLSDSRCKYSLSSLNTYFRKDLSSAFFDQKLGELHDDARRIGCGLAATKIVSIDFIYDVDSNVVVTQGRK
uniref:Uncharacterized protein n=1 Tax=Panagrolaimus davidi TaxID=227884 RepID=A0A914Q3T6_9BILA